MTEQEGQNLSVPVPGADTPATPVSNPAHYRLAFPFISLVGRGTELEQIKGLLNQPRIRLLTLTGAGGIGKTSLALSVCHAIQETFRDGVSFVPLAAIWRPEMVLPTIVEALDLPTGNHPTLEIIQMFLREKQLLLVLDNFEQVVEAAPHLTAILETCPAVKLLVTSRETLRVRGEHEFLLSPLALPDLTQKNDESLLTHNDAMALFVQRSQDTQADFCLTEANARIVAEICTRLDGLPLALELAAARINVFPLPALLSHLSHSLHILKQRNSDVPARQQTLRATIKWSYDLLSAEEQQLFRRLCIFVGGCSLETVEELYRLLGDEPTNVFEGCSQLLHKNLLKPGGQTREGPRILLLETIREFGLECLQATGEIHQVREAHAHYYLDWTRLGCQEMFGPEQLLWMTAFMQEMENLRTVMHFLLKEQTFDAALRLGGALGPLWMFLGTSNHQIYLTESTQFLAQALQGSEERRTGARARALVLLGGLRSWLGEAEQGELACREGLNLFRQEGDLQGVIHAHWMLYMTLFGQCNLPAAHRVAQEAATLARQYGSICTWWGASWTLGYSLFHLGMVSVYDGSYAEGRAALEEAVKLCLRGGDRVFSAWAALYQGEITALEEKDEEARTLLEQCVNAFRALEMKEQESEAQRFLGLLAARAGESERAQTLLAESVRLARATNDTQATVWALISSAGLKVAHQDLQAARTLLEEGLALAMSQSDRLTLPEGLERLGFVVATQGDPLRGACMFGVAEALRDAIDEPLPPLNRQEYDQQITAVQAMLDPVAFQEALASGRAQTAHQILARPEETKNLIHAALHSEHFPATPHDVAGLTRRERDVLGLVTEGLTNAQIAERLMLSVVTVNSYLRSTYKKLGVTSRTAAARYALDHDLL